MTALVLAALLAQTGPQTLDFKVGTGEDSERSAMVYKAKDTSKPSPLVFVWHGFTGGMRQAALAYKVHQYWPEATFVYAQGLEVAYLGKKGPGWQISPITQNGRDVKFFDVMLEKLKKDYNVDPNRIYTTGMSNGAIFSYVLLCERSDVFAAAAPVAGIAPLQFRNAKPKPILITHGSEDPLLPFKQAERSRDLAIENNGAGSTTKEVAPGYQLYTPVKNGMDVVWHQHEGGHNWPEGTSQAIVKFFKDHVKR